MRVTHTHDLSTSCNGREIKMQRELRVCSPELNVDKNKASLEGVEFLHTIKLQV
jgi:hypothetical protein